MKVVIIDYQMGNTKSVLRSFEKFTSDVMISSNLSVIESATHLVLPGVGSFADGKKHLEEMEIIPALIEQVKVNKTPFLGICLGMQLLASKGNEVEETLGLDLIPGVVKKLIPTSEMPVPHVGWNEIKIKQNHQLLEGIKDDADFYFVHSYHFDVANPDNIIAATPYTVDIASIIGCDNIVGTQFHPEKSQVSGLKLIKNFLSF